MARLFYLHGANTLLRSTFSRSKVVIEQFMAVRTNVCTSFGNQGTYNGIPARAFHKMADSVAARVSENFIVSRKLFLSER